MNLNGLQLTLGVFLLTAIIYFLIKKSPPKPVVRTDYCL